MGLCILWRFCHGKYAPVFAVHADVFATVMLQLFPISDCQFTVGNAKQCVCESVNPHLVLV